MANGRPVEIAQEYYTLLLTTSYLPKVLVYKTGSAGWYSLPLCVDSGISN